MKEARHKMPHIIWFCLCEMYRLGKTIQTKNRSVVSRDWGLGELWVRGLCLSDENILELESGNGCTLWIY